MTTLFPPTLDHVPVGFRFRPTDEELVSHYLKNKLLDNDSIVNNVIPEVDVCKYEPWELPACSVVKSDDPEWFFLCPIDYKYAKSKRFKRTTNNGFWKATGKDRKIKVRGSNNIIGIKKTLVYYSGRVPGVKSSWVIHEYHDTTFEDDKRTFVLCRLMKKAEKKAAKEADTDICDEGEPSRHMSSDHENQETFEGIPDVGDTLPEINMESIFQAQAEKYLPSISENEQEVSIPNSPLHDAYFRNDNIIVQSPFETIEEEDKFISSMIIDGDLDNAHVQSESLKMVYYGSSDTDAEVVSTPRTFVLCRLMKKAEKKAEKEAETDICDEGEPSRHMSSDHENQETFEGIPDVSDDTSPEINMESIFQAAEKYLPSISENEQEVSIPNSPLHDAYFRNDNIIVHSPFETIEEEDKFVNSMIIDGDLDNGHVQTESLKMVYYGSSDTDAEVVSTPCGDILDTSMAFLEHPSSGEYSASKLLKSTHGNVPGSTCFLSLKNGEIEDNNESTFRDDFGGLEASSCDSTADISLETINCIEISSLPSTIRKRKNQYHPRPAIFMSKRAALRGS